MAMAYTIVAVVMTWPLARHLARASPPMSAIPRSIAGCSPGRPDRCSRRSAATSRALAAYWNGNIFSPEPLTLAYSEH